MNSLKIFFILLTLVAAKPASASENSTTLPADFVCKPVQSYSGGFDFYRIQSVTLNDGNHYQGYHYFQPTGGHGQTTGPAILKNSPLLSTTELQGSLIFNGFSSSFGVTDSISIPANWNGSSIIVVSPLFDNDVWSDGRCFASGTPAVLKQLRIIPMLGDTVTKEMQESSCHSHGPPEWDFACGNADTEQECSGEPSNLKCYWGVPSLLTATVKASDTFTLSVDYGIISMSPSQCSVGDILGNPGEDSGVSEIEANLRLRASYVCNHLAMTRGPSRLVVSECNTEYSQASERLEMDFTCGS